MLYNPQQHHRRSIRLKGHDYTQPGAYFVTICTYQRVCLLGDVVEGVMRLNPVGQIAREQWIRLGMRFPEVDFSTFAIMPNHIHGIIVILDAANRRRGTAGYTHRQVITNTRRAPTHEQFGQPVAGSVPTIVRSYKSAVTVRIHHLPTNRNPPVWQRNYYEHIIRDEADLRRIYDYIQNNPARWEQDQLHPAALPNRFNQEKLHG